MDAFGEAKSSSRFVFSALTHDAAVRYEERYAAHGIPVITNAGFFHRQSADVPVLIPEVNPEHASIISIQQENRGWQGFIVANKLLFTKLHDSSCPTNHHFKVKRLHVTTMQAVSGLSIPGPASLDIMDNIIPYIANERKIR